MDKYLILLAGLPGTGKTTIAKKLLKNLENYDLVSQNEIIREFGLKKLPKNRDFALREVDKRSAAFLNSGKGVINDSVNSYSFRRQQIYGVASGCGVNAITIECISSEREAKTRMKARPKSDGLVSDPNDASVYDKLLKRWDNISEDYKYLGTDHVSHIRYDSEKNSFRLIRVGTKNHELRRFIKVLKNIILKK